jgi:hypothetical protein
MKIIRSLLFILLLTSLATPTLPAQAGSGVKTVSDQATLTFPESALFQAEFTSVTDINSVVLEYGVDQLTCGTVEAKAFPTFTAGTSVSVEWTWEMRQSGSVPPGATIWWRWQVTNTGGEHYNTSKKTILWLDDIHNWQVIKGGNINLHYYDEDSSFGQQLHDAAAQALVRLSNDVGLVPSEPVDIYIYANTDDLKAAVLYEPNWVGGQAFPEDDIVIIGVETSQLDWGKSTEAHELTHVLVGHLTFSCLGFIPTWLNEGLAMFGEGGSQPAELSQLEQAIASDQLLSLRSLSGEFSAESSRANLSYTEAYSVVNFMISTYGRNKMTSLLLALRDGQAADDALRSVYGFDTDGLEDAWRLSINAGLRSGSVNPTPEATPTNIPTFEPIGAAPVAVAVITTPHPTPGDTSQSTTSATQTPGTGNSTSTTGNNTTVTILVIGLVCLVVVLATIIILIIVLVRRQRRIQ